MLKQETQKIPLLQYRDTYADKIAATLRKFFRNSFACLELRMPVIIQFRFLQPILTYTENEDFLNNGIYIDLTFKALFIFLYIQFFGSFLAQFLANFGLHKAKIYHLENFIRNLV